MPTVLNTPHSHFNFSASMAEHQNLIVPSVDSSLVLVSVAIAIIASYIGFVITHKVSHNEFTQEANVWRLCAAIFLGVGIWAMHFVGMMAYRYGIPIAYDIPITLVSILPAALASYVVVSSQQLKKVPFVVRSILMGIGIGSMHYAGMMAMKMNAMMVYNPWLFGLSIIIAVLLSGVALKVDERQKSRTTALHSAQTLYAAIIMGLAISGMHYVGMYSMYVVDVGMSHTAIINTPPEELVRVILAVVFVSSLILLGLIEYRSRVLATARLNTVLDCVQEGFINFGRDGKVIYGNPAAARLFGIQQDAFPQFYISDLICDQNGNNAAILNSIMHLLDKHSPEQVTERLVGKKQSGEVFPIAITINTADNTEKSFVCIIRDLSDLSRQEVFTQNVFDNLPLAIIVKKASDLTIVHVNLAAQEILGQQKAELLGHNDFDIFEVEDAARITASDTNVLDTLNSATIQEEAVKIGDEIRYLSTRKTPIFDRGQNQQPCFLLTIIEDVTELRKTRQALEHANKRMAMAADAAQIGFWEWNAQTNELIWDDWMHKIYGLPKTKQQADYSAWAATVHPEDYPTVAAQFEEALIQKTEFHTEFRMLTPDDDIRYIKADGSAEGTKMFGINMDITARVIAEKEAERLSLTDSLTGLANRSALSQYLEREIPRNARQNTRLFCVYIDLDKFKPINDTYGHKAGDEVLIAIAKRLSDTVRQSDCAARIGGDEFVVMLTDIDNDNDAAHLSSRLQFEMTSPIYTSAGQLTVGASMGVAQCPADGNTIDELLSAADTKMYEQKRAR